MTRRESEDRLFTPGYCKICATQTGYEVFDVSRQSDTYAEYMNIQISMRDRSYFRCGACNIMYRSEFYSAEAKELLYAKFRDQGLRGETHAEYFERITSLPPERSENTEKYNFLESHIKSTGIHVDVGGGLGVFSYGFERHFPGWQSYCIEPTPEAGEVAKSFGVKFVNEYLSENTKIGEGDEADLITLNHVLEHVDQPQKFLETIRLFMKKKRNDLY